MGNSIGGNLEISAIMDASGIQTGADRGEQAMQNLSASAERMAANLAGVGSETVAMTSSLSNAARMVELLSAKMLASGSAAATARRASGANVQQELGLGPSRNPADSNVMAQLRTEIEERNRFNAVRIRQAAELATELASYARQEAADEDRIRAETMANLRRDIEQRSALERQRVTEQNGYARQEAADEDRIRAETMANLRRDIEQRSALAQQDRDDRLAFRMNSAQNSSTANPLQPMEDAILRMRAQLNPMVGMEARLAQEAQEFRRHMDGAVISGRLTWENAQRLTREFQTQENLLRQQGVHQQQGFMGMRRMGFAAQQFGYAIEDAASVYGTMGLAGAFRAAGNNLTAMAAQAGPVVGVIASLASAGVALGINLYNAAGEAKNLKKELDEIEELSKKLNDRWKAQIEIEDRLKASRTASHSELLSMYDQTIERLREINGEETARVRTTEQLLKLKQELATAEKLQGEIDKENTERWWKFWDRIGLLRGTGSGLKEIGLYFKDAFSGLKDMVAPKSDEQVKKENDRWNAQARADAEKAHQERMQAKADSPEQRRLDELNAQAAALTDRTRAMADERTFGDQSRSGRLNEITIAHQKLRSGEFDVSDSSTMRTKITGFGDNKRNFGDSRETSDDNQLANESVHLSTYRDSRIKAAQDEKRSVEERQKALEEIKRIEEEILRIDQMRVALNEAGQRSYESVNNSITGRFESFNEELRIENEILRTRKKMNEELDIAVRSRHLDTNEAKALSDEMEQAFQIEKDRRDNEKLIVDLKKRESLLQSNIRQDLEPATALGGLQRGSDEARAFLENERLRGMAANDVEPQIVELRKVRDEIKRLREANEKAASTRPKVAAMF